ncbi:MAG: septum formation initiator family protein [Tannerella sp.]|jgi:cell division protein FtsB|nr:septum formation initiator family protein [Tannerella sp.]
MLQIGNFFGKYISRLNKYWLVTIVFLLITFTVGDSNLYVRYKYEEKIRELEREIRYYRKEVEVNQKKLDDLRANKERMERYAREEFFMKKPGEDIFIIVDK